MKYKICVILSLAPFLYSPCPGYADEGGSTSYDDRLLGDIGGLRHTLNTHGVEFTLSYTADFWRETSGGRKRGGSYLDNLDIQFSIDGEKAYHLPGNKLFVYFLNNAGGHPNNLTGSVQGVDNIEVGEDAFKLYEIWMEQSFLDEKASLLIGLYDLNADFYVTDISANFINPAMGIGQEIAQTGENGPSIFPYTSLSARLRINPVKDSYFQLAVFDGVPGNPDHPHGTRIDLEKNDGTLWIAEAGFTPKGPEYSETLHNKIALGVWTYSRRFDDLFDTDSTGNPVKSRSRGIYALSSYAFYESEEENKALSAFLRAGLADGNTAQTDWAFQAGLVANGWVAGRPDAEIGLGVNYAHNADKYNKMVYSAGGQADKAETIYELYYFDALTQSIHIQPDIQYVVNPGTDPTLKNALIIGARLMLNF